MAQVTLQNAALVTMAALGYESLQNQGGKLAQMVSVFTLDGQGQAKPSRISADVLPALQFAG